MYIDPTYAIPLMIGALFGAGLFLSGLANPDKIIGTLRLKDFHAFRTIAVFLLVGMGGVWLLQLAGLANFSVKPANLAANLAGGALLGIGFGMSGYCPGTGLACAAAGRFDALITVLGMFGGALAFILAYPYVIPEVDGILAWGKITLPEWTNTDPQWWVLSILVVGTLVLWITKPRRERSPAE